MLNRSLFPPAILSLALLILAGPFAHAQFQHQIVDKQNPKDPWVKITGDLNGDGLEDVVIGGRTGPVVWYKNPSWEKILIGEGGYHTVDGDVGDIDRDGDLDVVVGAEFWYENPGPKSASQSPWTAHRISELRSHDVELCDLDQDGDLDLIARDQSGFGHNTGDKIHFWRQDSPTSWTHRRIDCPHGEGLTVGDLDRDGDLDVIAGRRWYENTLDIQNGKWPAYAFAPGWHQDTVVEMGDIDGDGLADIVLTRSEGPYKISWFKAPSDPKQTPWKEHVIDPSLDFAHGLELSDMDGDGDLDVAAAEMHQSERGRVLVYLNNKHGASWKTVVLAETGSHAFCSADFNNDGATDIMGANWSGGFQPVEIWLNQIPQRTQRFQTAAGPLIIYPIQHASFVMRWNHQTIFVDPVGGPDLYRHFPKADLILITHDHGDHLNQDVIDEVSSNRTKIVAPAPVIEKLNAPSKQRAVLMANGGKKAIGAVSIEAIPMYNTTPERLRYHQKGKGNGYVLTLGGQRIYISGDTEDIPEMRALRGIDIAFVCMNLPYTMTVEQAADAVREFKPKIVYPYHSRGSDLQKFQTLVGGDLPIEVKIVDWYAN